MNTSYIHNLLEEKLTYYNHPRFIADDPICIPRSFTGLQDKEIMGFWAAVLAWGQRKTIINKCKELVERMDGSPYDFIMNHSESDLKAIEGFKHRTFNDTDALYFITFFKNHYAKNISLESAFISPSQTAEDSLSNFYHYFFSFEAAPQRTHKHIASPTKKSACKRINMFLRWMVRQDDHGVDLGLWKNISTAQLVCPLDVHVDRVARKLGLLKHPQSDWLAATELTNNLKKMDANDPVKYDFALFGLGLEGFAK